jgi:uncharacterized protein (TIGR02444 family)
LERGMTVFPSHPAWGFVTRLYAAPGVGPACLDLQERHGVNVTFMLFCLWRGAADGRALSSHMRALAATARDWHEAVVLPVRTARRKLKDRDSAAALYRTVLAAEIDCEHAELLALAGRADALCGPADGKGSASIMANNLDAFFAAVGVVPAEHDRPAVDTVLEAAGGIISPE